MIALITESASKVRALAITDGVVMIALDAARAMVSDAVVTESVLRASAIATPAGLGMHATFVLACTTALSMDIATTEPACAKRDTTDVTALSLQSHSRASARFIACVDAFSSAPRCTRHKELVHRMSATPSALRSACHSVLLERCQ